MIPSFSLSLLPLLLVPVAALAQHRVKDLALEDPIRLDDQTIAPHASASLLLPPLPPRPDRLLVLRFRAVITAPSEAGCMYNAEVLLNGTPLSARSATGSPRLLGRAPGLELADPRHLGFPVYSGDRLMLMYAPSPDRGDPMTTDGLGATFLLDISDLARGVDGNTLTFRNVLVVEPKPGFGDLRVENIEVGWLDPSSLPSLPNAVPQRGPIARGVERDGLRLEVGTAGGFAVKAEGGMELRVETGLGMTPAAPSTLLACDDLPATDATVDLAGWGPSGFRVQSTWPGLTLRRILDVREGQVIWKERWTNTGDKIRGVPARHRLFLPAGVGETWLGGSPDNVALAGAAANPTLFLEQADAPGRGFGVVAESDWLRLLMALRQAAGVAELFTETLALPPGGSVDFDLTITPVKDGGYWSFINHLRQAWGVNGITQERPVFWGYAVSPEGQTWQERVGNALAHLGPIYVVLGPWQRLEPDARTVTAGQYPKLPPDAPRTPGDCPDLDVDAFLTFAHREPYRDALAREVALIRQSAPQARVMQMLHPAMEVVYKPLADRWPMAAEAIATSSGDVFEDSYYSRAWLGDMVEKGWGVLYYVPRPGSTYLRLLLEEANRALDELGLDGLYCDEFSWAYNTRGYSRYDYSRWDGYSADLDETGQVVRLKADNAAATEAFQLQLIDAVLSRGRYFLNNGGNALHSVGSRRHARFIEGGSGVAAMVQGHLSPTPLVLGNMGDTSTREGVFASARVCLAHGCVYSPMAVNLLLEGSDNFVCKLYPLTVQEIGPGWVIARERIATIVSRDFAWPAQTGKVRLFRYNAQGNLIRPVIETRASGDGPLSLEVPEKGMVIAEFAPPPADAG